MKLLCLAFLLLVAFERCPAQSTSGSFSFPGPVISGSQAHFGLEFPGFTDTSARRSDWEAVSRSAASARSARYGYPLRPFLFGTGASDDIVLGTRGFTDARQLILVFRNQTIDTSSACWIEGKMLHYINSFNSPETVPVRRVNWKLTEATNSIKPGTLLSRLGK